VDREGGMMVGEQVSKEAGEKRMHAGQHQLRKAALLIRSVDGDTAATLLAQLSPEEASAVRAAMLSLGRVDPAEQADLVAEFRRSSPSATTSPEHSVELSISGAATEHSGFTSANVAATTRSVKRFDFLEIAPIRNLVPYLAREHAQTIAVVLSHLEPSRAAAVLAELPRQVQSDVLERLSNLGETDAEAVRVLEHELAAWMKERAGLSSGRTNRQNAAASILNAADAKTRDRIAETLKSRNAMLAKQLFPPHSKPVRHEALSRHLVVAQRVAVPGLMSRALRPMPVPESIKFDNLIHLDGRSLARLLQTADPNVLALALVGSRDELVDRVCDQMPKRMAKAFRRELRRLGPTRLSDVETAQRAIAQLAAQQLAERRATFAGARV
jgi:flagellar motor switch protein FliG